MRSVTTSTPAWCPSGGTDSSLGARVLSKGGWSFTPRPVPEASAILNYRGNRIELMYSTAAFESFLAAMIGIQDEFERLWPGRSDVARHADGAGQTCHD